MVSEQLQSGEAESLDRKVKRVAKDPTAARDAVTTRCQHGGRRGGRLVATAGDARNIDAQDGAAGVNRNGICAWTGVRSPSRWLHGPRAATVFTRVFLPPRELGCTWSTVVALVFSSRSLGSPRS